MNSLYKVGDVVHVCPQILYDASRNDYGRYFNFQMHDFARKSCTITKIHFKTVAFWRKPTSLQMEDVNIEYELDFAHLWVWTADMFVESWKILKL